MDARPFSLYSALFLFKINYICLMPSPESFWNVKTASNPIQSNSVQQVLAETRNYK